ncbi:MAG: S1/P1 nuclease [Anaeromyxobacteraceae bacterium]
MRHARRRPFRPLPGAALAVAVAFLAALAPRPALAWDARGHRLVARIAEARLDARARAAARALLDAPHLAGVATWADAEAKRRRETGPWHWVNIAAADGGYDRPRHCPAGDCIVARIEHFARVLGDRRAPRAERATALRFLVHLVADLHQPMHAGRPEDRGGNGIAVVAEDGAPTNLHHAYDDLPERCAPPRRERDAARALAAGIAERDARAWSAATPADWATESHLLAQHAYAALGPPGRDGLRPLLPDGGRRCAMAREQLRKAGVRLGAVIEGALGGG